MQRFCWIKTRRQANLGLGEETQGSELFWSPEAVWKSLSGKKGLLSHTSLVLQDGPLRNRANATIFRHIKCVHMLSFSRIEADWN